MRTRSATITVETKGWTDIVDITGAVRDELRASGVTSGTVTVFVPGSTAGITTIEYEPGAVADLKRAIERIAPHDTHYDHDARWGDGNGFAHVRAALLGPSLSIPVIGGELSLGTWQQIILVDFDNRERRRPVVVQVCGSSTGAH